MLRGRGAAGWIEPAHVVVSHHKVLDGAHGTIMITLLVYDAPFSDAMTLGISSKLSFIIALPCTGIPLCQQSRSRFAEERVVSHGTELSGLAWLLRSVFLFTDR